MNETVLLVTAGAVFVIALVVAWKITWFVLKVVFWMVALGTIAGAIWWYTQRPGHQHAGSGLPSQPIPDYFVGPLPRVMPRAI